MGLFDKKTCDFCDGNIGLLGNKKYAEGNMCKTCASKLSPWFKRRKESTKMELDGQLAYREQNLQAVMAFQTTRSIGKTTKLLIDDNARKFMVTNASDLVKANPDVLDFSCATGCRLDMQESRHEIKQKTADGKQVSYNPPRYEYSYDFNVTIQVNTPYFNEMRYSISDGYVRVGENPMHNPSSPAGWAMRRPGVSLLNGARKYDEYVALGEEIKEAVYGMMGVSGAGMPAQPMQPMQPMQGQPMQGQPMQQMPIQPQMNAPRFCPFCGGRVTPGARFCEACGGQIA